MLQELDLGAGAEHHGSRILPDQASRPTPTVRDEQRSLHERGSTDLITLATAELGLSDGGGRGLKRQAEQNLRSENKKLVDEKEKDQREF
jgi:hypothetical protein